MTTDQMLRAAFGIDVGLNADWSLSAWCVFSTGVPNQGQGLYLVDNEDETFSLVRRNFEVEDSAPEEILTVHEVELEWLIVNATERRNAIKAARWIFQ